MLGLVGHMQLCVIVGEGVMQVVKQQIDVVFAALHAQHDVSSLGLDGFYFPKVHLHPQLWLVAL